MRRREKAGAGSNLVHELSTTAKIVSSRREREKEGKSERRSSSQLLSSGLAASLSLSLSLSLSFSKNDDACDELLLEEN